MFKKESKTFVVGHRNFYVKVIERIVYVGKTTLLGSNMAAGMVVRETMEPVGFKSTGTWMNIESNDDEWVLGAGYEIPRFMPRWLALKKVRAVLQKYGN